MTGFGCDICGRKLTKRENEVYDEIFDDNEPCYCCIVVRIVALERRIKGRVRA